MKDFLIPVAAILIPTLIAVKVARDERLASAAARAEDRRLALKEDLERSTREGGLAAMQAMEELLTAAQHEIRNERGLIITRSRALIATITLHLGVRHGPVWLWIIRELTVVAQSLDAESSDGLPRHFELIKARHSAFQITMLNWLQGLKDDAWFADREQVPLADTPLRPAGGA